MHQRLLFLVIIQNWDTFFEIVFGLTSRVCSLLQLGLTQIRFPHGISLGQVTHAGRAVTEGIRHAYASCLLKFNAYKDPRATIFGENLPMALPTFPIQNQPNTPQDCRGQFCIFTQKYIMKIGQR